MSTYRRLRPLSPITELATPISPTIMSQSQIEHYAEDYASERGDDLSPDGSVYSNQSGDTVVPISEAHETHSIITSPALPNPPARSDRRPMTFSPLKTIPFPTDRFPSLPSPRSLPPPPRPVPYKEPPPLPISQGSAISETRQRDFPLDPGDHPREETQRSEDSFVVLEDSAGMAGVGAGEHQHGSLESERRVIRDIPVPHTSRLQPAAQNIYDAPLLRCPDSHSDSLVGPHAELVPAGQSLDPPEYFTSDPKLRSPPSGRLQKVQRGSPPIDQPSSLGRRPHNYHGMRSDDDASTLAEMSRETPRGVSDLSHSHPENTSLRPTLNTRQISAIPSSPPQSTASPPSSPQRRRTVSSIFSSIFSLDKSISTETRSRRRLSRHRQRTISGDSGMANNGASPILPADVGAELETAIRTSGTFGIRDDGSELHTRTADEPVSPKPVSSRQRTQSSSGSVLSQGSQPILFVQNVDQDIPNQRGPGPDVQDDQSIADSKEASYTPISSPADVTTLDTRSPIASTATTASDLRKPQPSRNVMPSRPPIGRHRRSFSPPSARSAMFMPLKPQSGRDRPLTPPPPRASPSNDRTSVSDTSLAMLEEEANNEELGFETNLLKGEMVDQAIQTLSPQSTVSPRRDMMRVASVISRTPSLDDSTNSHPSTHLSSPIAQSLGAPHPPSVPQPNFPPPPGFSPSPSLPTNTDSVYNNVPAPHSGEGIPQTTSSSAPDLPLLIASHLLNTHAAALMQQSNNMRDYSEAMRQMARESLDWGGVLLGMGTGIGRAVAAEESSYPRRSAGVPRSSAPVVEGLPSDTYDARHEQQDNVEDPLHRAWASLHGKRPPPAQFNSTHPWHDPQILAASTLPGNDVQEQVDRLTRVPPRLSNSQYQSRRDPPSHERSRGVPSRTRPESLPADWLRAEKLGRKGWDNLHRAEEAWSDSMEALRQLVEGSRIIPEEKSLDPDKTVRARTRSRHMSLDIGMPPVTTHIDPNKINSRVNQNGNSRWNRDLDQDMARGENEGSGATPPPPSLFRRFRISGDYGAQGGYTEQQIGQEYPYHQDTQNIQGDGTTLSASSKTTRKLSKTKRARDPVPPLPSNFRYPQQYSSTAGVEVEVEIPEDGQPSQGRTQKGKQRWWSRK